MHQSTEISSVEDMQLPPTCDLSCGRDDLLACPYSLWIYPPSASSACLCIGVDAHYHVYTDLRKQAC